MTYYSCTVGSENIRTLHLRNVTPAYVVAMHLYDGQVYPCCICVRKARLDQEPPRYLHSAQHLNVLEHWYSGRSLTLPWGFPSPIFMAAMIAMSAVSVVSNCLYPCGFD